MILNEGKKQAEERFLDTNLINPGTFNELLNSDPTNNKKYIEKICEFFIEMKTLDRWRHEHDLNIILQLSHLILEFDAACNRNLITGNDKDVQQYSSILNFETIVLESRTKISNTQKKKKIRSENSVEVYEDDAWLVTLLLNWTGSKAIGMGTAWCITWPTPVHWLRYVWRDGQHFYVITNKELLSEPVPDKEKDPLSRVAAQVNYNGGLDNFWDAPDNPFNPTIGAGSRITTSRQLWWDSLPDKVKELIKTPEPEGESRKVLVHNYDPELGHNQEKNQESIIFKDFYINSKIPPINLSKFKNIDFQIDGNIIVSDTDYTSLEEINFSSFPSADNIKIEGNKKLKSLKGLPLNILGTLTIENNPELGNDAIDDLIKIKLRKHLTWKNNKDSATMQDFIVKKWAPILGGIRAK